MGLAIVAEEEWIPAFAGMTVVLGAGSGLVAGG